ncbi:glycosyltransferase [Oceanobacillus sp. AG]|uniref:glycosyltransferase n=1 Tax=Oceanobacillus sp. AG TaxID=2681969 RepID=UPI0012EC8B66|nr:glycosyltransferase [Oceanobacillus sp. AG]
MKVLHIFAQMNRGGAEGRTLDVMRSIENSGIQFDFCSLSGKKGSYDEEIESLGGKVHYCNLKSFKFEKLFREILRKEKYDVVHSHVHYPSGYILRLAHRENIPARITHFRNSNDTGGQSLKRTFQRVLLKRWINKYSTDIISVSKGAMEIAWNENWESDVRCKVIYNGIPKVNPKIHNDIKKELGIPQQNKIYINVARMSKQKNHMKLIDIFSEIVKKDKQSTLLLVGKKHNEIEQQITQRINELNLKGNVIILGERTDVARILTGADLFLFPSLWEGLPGAVLEAVSLGIPVLASSIPGVKEIANEFNIVKYFSVDEPSQIWADRALYMINDKNLYNIAKKESTTFEQSIFGMENCINQYKQLYNK